MFRFQNLKKCFFIFFYFTKQTLDEVSRVCKSSRSEIDKKDGDNLALIEREIQMIKQKLNKLNEQIVVCMTEIYSNVT